MDNCTKLKLFNILLLLCAVNFLIYRWFTGPTSFSTNIVRMDQQAALDGSAAPPGGAEATPDSQVSVFDPQFAGKLSLKPSQGGTNNAGGTSVLVGDHPDQSNKQSEVTNTGDASVNQAATAAGDGGQGSGAGAATVALGQVQGTLADLGRKLEGEGVTTEEKKAVTEELNLCPLVPPSLIGPLATYRESQSLDQTAQDNPGVSLGGRYTPTECTARHSVAIVIPYRNREEHLKILVRNLHPLLRRQQLDYGIYVVDQALPGRFNRAMLMNIGYVEAMKRHDYQCAIFHDVDLIPEDDRNLYSCPAQPRHMSASIDKFRYKLPYAGIFGGVSAINKEQFQKLNGFSNMFFGWGGEDDDMAKRLGLKGLKITRYPMEIARYKMVSHKRETFNEVNPKRFELLRTTAKRQPTDGLNSLKYELQTVEELPTHTRLQVLIKETDIMGQH